MMLPTSKPKARLPLVLGGIKDFLRIHQTGSKSGALLLTMLDFTIPRGDERLTKGGAESAVRNATSAATHAALEQPASIWTRAALALKNRSTFPPLIDPD
jgi:hypothetical protein